MKRLAQFLDYKSWFVQDVIFPYAVTRVLLLVVGWFSQYFVRNPFYPSEAAVQRGWLASSVRLLDIWGRWDSGWYYSIVQSGYTIPDQYYRVQSNIVFFPLYPYLVKMLAMLFPSQSLQESRLLFIGVLISNAALLIGLTFLYKLVIWITDHQSIARQTIWYILLFPAGFFLSSFYTEALFFCLSVMSLYFGHQQKWGRASMVGYLLAFTRPTGVLIAVPLVWQYLRSKQWSITAIRPSILWFLLVPLGLVSFFNIGYNISGDYLAPVHAQQAWGRTTTMPWTTFFADSNVTPFVTPVETVLAVFCIALGILSFKYLPDKSVAIFGFLLLLPPLFSGTLTSISRYYSVLFPLFMTLSIIAAKKPWLAKSIPYVFLTLQVLFFVAWSQFYWID